MMCSTHVHEKRQSSSKIIQILNCYINHNEHISTCTCIIINYKVLTDTYRIIKIELFQFSVVLFPGSAVLLSLSNLLYMR